MRSSDPSNTRPIEAPTPSTEKKFPETNRPFGCSSSVAAALGMTSSRPVTPEASSPLNHAFRSRISLYTEYVNTSPRTVDENAVTTRYPIVPECHQPTWLPNGKRTQLDGVDDREDRGVGTDAQRECREQYRGERRLSPEATNGVPCILRQVVPPIRSARARGGPLVHRGELASSLSEVAELANRLGACVVPRSACAGAEERVRAHLNVKANFVVDMPRCRAARANRQNAADHQASPEQFRGTTCDSGP